LYLQLERSASAAQARMKLWAKNAMYFKICKNVVVGFRPSYYDASPPASEMSQATNEFDVPVGRIGSYLKPTFVPSYIHGSATTRPLFLTTSIRDRFEIIPLDAQLGRSYPLARRSSLWYENPPWRLSLLCWLQLSGTISAIHGFCYTVRSSPR